MPYHIWGDWWFKRYGKQLTKAINEFTHICHTYGRMYFWPKEKYGTMRLDVFRMSARIDYLLGYNIIYIQYPILHWVSKNILDPIVRRSYLYKLIFKYQILIFNVATLKVCKKYPKIVREITFEPWFEELLYDWVKKCINYECHWVNCDNITTGDNKHVKSKQIRSKVQPGAGKKTSKSDISRK